MAFVVFSVILGVLFFETYSTYKRTKSSIFLWSKFIFYALAVIVLLFKWWNNYVLTNINIIMLSISTFGIIIRKYIRHLSLDNKTSILILIQIFAVLPWNILFILATYNHPSNFWLYSLVYWLLQIISYILSIYWTYNRKEPKSWYIFSIFWLILCIIYCVFIIMY